MKNKKFSPEDFLTRAEKVRLIEFPSSDETRVIVAPNNEAIGFKFNCYKEQYLRDRVERSIFDQTVKEANKICENVWRQKKIQETEDFSAPLKYILYWAVFLSMVAFILLVVLVYEAGDDTLLYGAVILICVASGLTMLVVIRSLIAQPKFIELEPEIMRQLTIYFDEKNRNVFEKRGCVWVVESRFYWLELKILPK